MYYSLLQRTGLQNQKGYTKLVDRPARKMNTSINICHVFNM